MKRKSLRSGYTTGACAAAAAKAAALILLGAQAYGRGISDVKQTPSCSPASFCSSDPPSSHAHELDIPFPDGSRATFAIHHSGYDYSNHVAFASVIKDAGDDPDVTNGAEIVAEARIECKRGGSEGQKEQTQDSNPGLNSSQLIIKGGRGVGVITKPGLAMPAGEPAINPVPRKMIANAVSEAFSEMSFRYPTIPFFRAAEKIAVEVTISVTDGELLARKTLNERLGIIGGLSILGTTGIVRPLSAEAWTATISSSMDVAKAMGREEIVLSAGRTSENAHMKMYSLSEESYVMMGDYLEFSLREAKKHFFPKINLCAQWAKMLKIAMATSQTHVRHGAIDIEKSMRFLNSLGLKIPEDSRFNTAREIFDFILQNSTNPQQELIRVCNAAKLYADSIADPTSLVVLLVSYDGEIIAKNS